jgi:hypothetical protein
MQTNFSPVAEAELAKQIEELAPSPPVLTAAGWPWQTAAELARQIQNGPDLTALRECGIGQDDAVSICEAISARHARVAAAQANVPKSVPLPPIPAAPAAPVLDAMSALSRLHTLFEEGGSGRRACLTTLMNDGWSEATSRELVKVIDASLGIQRGVTR